MRILTTTDTIWFNVVLRASPNWTSQISYDDVASHVSELSVWAALIYFDTIITSCNGPLEAAHAHIHDERYDMVQCGAAGQPNWISQISYDDVASHVSELSV